MTVKGLLISWRPGGELGERFEFFDLKRSLKVGLQLRKSGELVGSRRRAFH
jgi:hypothetical protein